MRLTPCAATTDTTRTTIGITHSEDNDDDEYAADARQPQHGRSPAGYGRQVVADALAETGVELGAHDRRIAEWLGGFEATTAVTIASWLLRAHEAGQAIGRDTI